ncbi:MAG: sulfotransferase [Gammaproteobacteria bacterium]|nr:sulfotransferase [Pseudomonadales bacterium]
MFSIRLYGKLCWQSLTHSGRLTPPGFRQRLLRLLLFLLMLPVLLLHWLGFLLDEILFRGYRRVTVRQPLFVLGVPRSGTTFLHRTLGADDGLFTTVSTWEVMLAPSITQRLFWRLLARIDRLLGAPGARLIGYLEKCLFRGMEGVHDVSLQAAEEDYLLLLPLMSCFILFLPFTESGYIWSLSRLDWQMPESDRQRIMDFYRACLQKHLYVHGQEKCYLAKNAAFASWILTLQRTFPDARLVVCMREPEQAVPSLIGSLLPGARFFDLDLTGGYLPERLVRMMQDSYHHLLSSWRADWELIQMHELRADPGQCVARIYHRFDLPLTAGYRRKLAVLLDEASHYATRTRPIDPAPGDSRTYFRQRFPWYYEFLNV